MQLRRASSLATLDERRRGPARRRHRGRAAAARGLLQADALVDIAASCGASGIDGAHAHRRRRDARRARGDPQVPGRAARGVPARRDRRSSATWAPSAATCCSRRAAGTGGSSTRAGSTAATRATRARASTASTRSSRTTSAPRRTRPTSPRRCSRSARRLRTNRRELPVAELYRLPTEDDRRTTTLEPGELILELDVPRARRVRLPEGDGPEALGVPARRRRRRAHAAASRGWRSPAWRRCRGCSTGGSTRRRRSPERVQGRDRPRAREARARGAG